MREEQRDIEPGNKVEEKHSRNERVLGGDEVKHQHSNTGQGLAKTEAMLPKQLIVQEIVFRAAARKRFQEHSENEQAAVDAVTSPGQFRARRVKRHHYPDTEPEQKSDDDDLAEQEKAVETFRALRNHGYGDGVGLRVRDGGVASTRDKLGANMRAAHCADRAL